MEQKHYNDGFLFNLAFHVPLNSYKYGVPVGIGILGISLLEISSNFGIKALLTNFRGSLTIQFYPDRVQSFHENN